MELIKITTNELGVQVVSARELYGKLELAIQHYSKWCKQNIERNQFAIDQQDYAQLPLSGRTIDYALTVDFAKRLAMMARTEAGETVRSYFIECERKAKEAIKPMSQLDMIIQSALELKRQEERTSALENKVMQLEAKTTTRPDYSTVVGYAVMHGLTVGLQMAAKIGAKARSMCNSKGIIVESIPDPRFGRVGMYPSSILEEAFNSVLV